MSHIHALRWMTREDSPPLMSGGCAMHPVHVTGPRGGGWSRRLSFFFYPTCFPRASGFVESIKAQRTTPSGLIIEPAGLLQFLLSAVWQSCAYRLRYAYLLYTLNCSSLERLRNPPRTVAIPWEDTKTLGFLFLLA